MKSFTTLLLFFASVLFSSLFSQGIELKSTSQNIDNTSSVSHPQIGLSIGIDKSISGAFRKNLSETKVLRINLKARINAAFIDASSRRFSTLIDLNIGKEQHIKLGERFSFYTGGEVGLYTVLGTSNSRRFGANAFALSGIKFKANEKVSFFTEVKLGLEVNAISASQNIYWTTRSDSAFNFGALYSIGKIIV